jgi:dsRNA-specific ribonuclease
MIKTDTFDPKNDFLPPLVTVPYSLKEEMVEHAGSCSLLYRLKLTEAEVKCGQVSESNANKFRQLFLDYQPQNDQPLQIFLSQQSLNDKKVSDTMEALLGVCVNTVGFQRSFNFLPYFDILPKENLTNLMDAKLFPNIKYTPDVDKFLINYKTVERTLNYKFTNRALLLQALTHASHPTNRATGSYEVLEFMGDAVLDILITCYIYQECTTFTPGQLTDLRSALVNNVTLACILVRNDLHRYILAESASLSDSIEKFVQFQRFHDHQITDQVQLLVEEQEMKMADYVDVPKALGDVFESLIGAIFVDSGNDLKVRQPSVNYSRKSNGLLLGSEFRASK